MLIREGDTFSVGAPGTPSMRRRGIAGPHPMVVAQGCCPCCHRPFQKRNQAIVRYWLGKLAVCSMSCVRVEEETRRMRRS